MTAPLQISSLSKTYHKKRVLEGVGLSLAAGEVFGLIGLNGAGKTTLIKVLLDLASADAGTVELFGVSSRDAKARRQLCYLPEKFQPSRYLRGYEYLELSLAHYGKRLARESMRAMAVNFDLPAEALDARVGSYSKGMGQKLGLLGTFMVDTPLLILDEPMSGLDPSARIKLKRMLLEAKASGRTIFFSSHILSDIDEICDRIGIIHQGKLGFVGTPASFKAAHGGESLERAFLHSIAA